MDAVLEHIPDVGKAFSEVSRVLKKNGVFIGYVFYGMLSKYHTLICHLKR